ncbi:MAG: hypothetical protein M3Y82_04040, partial [Verrucomicrobiota bacterium]|nr:hypothetical protein [Verrucomicrobiota bacterium]
VYVVKCAKCHELYDPKKYEEADWNLWMEKMRRKSKLKSAQFDLLKRYIQTLREDPGAPKNP